MPLYTKQALCEWTASIGRARAHQQIITNQHSNTRELCVVDDNPTGVPYGFCSSQDQCTGSLRHWKLNVVELKFYVRVPV